MLYYIDGKVYILVSEIYKEVTIKKLKDTYKVEPIKNGKTFERAYNEYYPTISVEEAYKKLNKTDLGERHSII